MKIYLYYIYQLKLFKFSFFRISDYDSDIDKLKSLGITLDSTNIQNYLNALKAERAEQNKNKTITEKDEE